MPKRLTPAARIGLQAIVSALLLMGPSISRSVGEEHRTEYAKRATWLETLIASREAMRPLADAGEKLYVSPVMTGGQDARHISADVAGWSDLFLFVLGAPEVVYGAATWADARLIDAQGRATRVCEIKTVKLLDGQLSPDANLESGVSGPLKIAGKRFEHGLHVYPNGRSKLHVPLGGKFVRFEAEIGIDDWVGRNGAVRFVVAGAAGAARLDVWERLSLDFSQERSRREMKWAMEDRVLEADWQPGHLRALADRFAEASHRVPALMGEARRRAERVGMGDLAGLREVQAIYHRSRELDEVPATARAVNFAGLRLAIDDLSRSFPGRYAGGLGYLQRLGAIENAIKETLAGDLGEAAALERLEGLIAEFRGLQRQALLANPLLDFEKLLVLRRTPMGDPRMPVGTGYQMGEYIGLPRQTSKHDPDIERYTGWENDIAVLPSVRAGGPLATIYKPEGQRLINDLDLHWDGQRLLFSMPASHNKWQIFEVGVDGGRLRQVTPGDQPDVHSYDACYLPDGKIAFLSTAPLQGVPCNAGVIVGMMYTMNADGSGIRQVCFEQDHDYCPTVLNDGRVLYLRWDYTDTPHVWNRMLFAMNPDGTGQSEYYGANSYWPNAIFYARAIPDHPTKVVGIVTGHHVGRVGELVVFDPSQGRFEADGVVQRIPGRGQKVEPLIQDKLTEHSWPKFLHPQPLSENYFIVSCKPTPDSLWGIYLADTFDNLVLIREEEGQALLEPIPLRKTNMPPVIPSRVKPDMTDALVYLQDVYAGPGMKGVPQGTIRKLRVFTYHFGYQRIAGIDHRVGADGPWEAKRVLGTVPVEADGSAFFRIPAKTPLSVQPLDEQGRAVALMRTWMTAMPGETLSCVGCHDNRGGSPPPKKTAALAAGPRMIEPWYGPVRGFSFGREVQPVLDRYCVGCHDGRTDDRGRTVVDLRREQDLYICYKGGDPEAQVVRGVKREDLLGKFGGIFEPSYIALRRLVRVGGLESDLHMLNPMEFHADTTELVQMLRKGHYGVELDAEAWDRIYTWIDLNAPCHGTWSELTKIQGDQRQRRRFLQQLYGGIDHDPEDVVLPPSPAVAPILPAVTAPAPQSVPALAGWPFDVSEAQRRQGNQASMRLELGHNVGMELVRIPAGSFVMGDREGADDERLLSAVKIDRACWMGRFEVTNEQYALFDASHDSRFEHRSSWIFSEEYLGWRLNHPRQPVVRVSWQEAMAYCNWLSQKTGRRFSLPTEAQWEYACRAGSDQPLSFGGLDADFSRLANMADRNIRRLAYEGWRPKSPDLAPRDARWDDGALVTADVGRYLPNAWGLHDMHGNAAEWTLSQYRPYPYMEDGRSDAGTGGQKVVRGGSWFDRPHRCRSGSRQAYQPYQRVFNVGFRVICE